MTRWLLHPRLTLLVRLTLGLTFILAALPKIVDPPSLAKTIWAYQLVPAPALNPMALVLPWLELSCGLALVAGTWVRAAALWVGALLARRDDTAFPPCNRLPGWQEPAALTAPATILATHLHNWRLAMPFRPPGDAEVGTTSRKDD